MVVNLYPFLEKVSEQKSLSEMIEYIDIGGPAMLRAAAKNHEFVTTLHHPSQYEEFLKVWTDNNYSVPSEMRFKWASDIFFYTAYYDSQISRYLDAQLSDEILPGRFSQFFQKQQDLRYGENPHQPGAIYQGPYLDSPAGEMIEKLWGKEMSFNNYVDVAAAFSATLDFHEPAVAIIKHTNPCGLAVDTHLSVAFNKAREGDPVSAFGGIVASNQQIDQ